MIPGPPATPEAHLCEVYLAPIYGLLGPISQLDIALIYRRNTCKSKH